MFQDSLGYEYSSMTHASYTPTNSRLAAYQRLGIDPERVYSSVKIAPHLRRIPGGIDFALECLRSSSDPLARRFLLVYDDVTLTRADRDLLPIEAFCIAGGIDPSDLFGLIVTIASRLGAQLGNVIAAVNHPAIVQTSVAAALTPEGVTDRMAQLKHSGFLPIPKGSQVNVAISASATAQSASVSASALSSPEDSIRKLESAFSGLRGDLAPTIQMPALTEGTHAPTLADVTKDKTLDSNLINSG